MTRPCNQPSEELTQRDWSQLLLPWTVHMKSSEEQVAETCPSNSNWFEFVGHDLLQKYLAIIQPFWHHFWSTTHINTVPNLLSCIMLDYFKNIFPILFYFKLKTSCFGFALASVICYQVFQTPAISNYFLFP